MSLFAIYHCVNDFQASGDSFLHFSAGQRKRGKKKIKKTDFFCKNTKCCYIKEKNVPILQVRSFMLVERKNADNAHPVNIPAGHDDFDDSLNL